MEYVIFYEIQYFSKKVKNMLFEKIPFLIFYKFVFNEILSVDGDTYWLYADGITALEHVVFKEYSEDALAVPLYAV
jgi:hypothetical protein